MAHLWSIWCRLDKDSRTQDGFTHMAGASIGLGELGDVWAPCLYSLSFSRASFYIWPLSLVELLYIYNNLLCLGAC